MRDNSMNSLARVIRNGEICEITKSVTAEYAAQVNGNENLDFLLLQGLWTDLILYADERGTLPQS